MSLMIKGMDMPKSCFECRFYQNEMDYCEVTDTDYPFLEELKLKDCPLSEIPTPHGRLIDADRLEDRIKNMVGKYDTAIPLNVVYGLIAYAHPIIEAEE